MQATEQPPPIRRRVQFGQLEADLSPPLILKFIHES